MNIEIAEFNRSRSSAAYALPIRKHAIELARTALALTRPCPKLIRFVIFGQGRCGSTLLSTILDSHPSVTCKNELLSMRHLFPIARVARFERAAPPGTTAFGFHLKPWHVTRVLRRDLSSFVGTLDRRGHRFIHLQRTNWFLQSLSQVKLYSHGVVHAKSADHAPTGPLVVAPEILVLTLRAKEAMAAEESAAVSSLSRPAIRVIYEEDLASPDRQQATASRLFAELGLEDSKVETPLQKVSPQDWRLGVSNVEEVENSMRAAGFERFLEMI